MKPIQLEIKTYEELKEELGNEYDTAMYEINISALKEIERLNKEKENLTNIVANKIIKDYDIETPLKDELNKSRLKNLGLESQVNRLNNIIKRLEEYTDEDDWTSVNGEIAVRLIKLKLQELKGDGSNE